MQTISWKQKSHNTYNGSIIDSIVVPVKTMKGFASRKHQVNSGYFKALLIGNQKMEIFKLPDIHENFGHWILAFICSTRSNSPPSSLPSSPSPPIPSWIFSVKRLLSYPAMHRLGHKTGHKKSYEMVIGSEATASSYLYSRL